MLIVGTTFVLVAVLFLLLQRTKLGLMIRALAENEDAARLMGINVGLTVAAVSFLSGTLGGAAGVLIGLNFNAIQPFMGEHMMLRGFAVIIIGGLGDIRGALIAGVLLGVLEVLTAGYISSNAKEAVAFTILVLTLWFRPVGLFGRAQAKRA
jgi:branched-chain amino acid transport system permease protein